jgi:TolB protein
VDRKALEDSIVERPDEEGLGGLTGTFKHPDVELAYNPDWWRLDEPDLHPLSGDAPPGPAPAPPTGTIVFQRWTTAGTQQIFRMDPTGANQTNLSNSPWLDGDPHLSRDGLKIAFSRSMNGGPSTIWKMRSDGTNKAPVTTPVTGGYGDSAPVWSADGAKIAFARNYQIWVVNSDGTNPHPLMAYPTNPFSIDLTPDWSPRGTEIAFWRQAGGSSAIMTIDIPGGIPQYVTAPDGNQFAGFPSYSPSGAEIAYWVGGGGNGGGIWKKNSDGSGQATQLSKPDAQHGQADWACCWSPTGDALAFGRTKWVEYFLWTMDSAGGAQTERSTPPPAPSNTPHVGYNDSNPSWR